MQNRPPEIAHSENEFETLASGTLAPNSQLLSKTKKVYMDHNATTPIASFLVDFCQKWLTHWGNPSSIHWAGREPKALMRESRKKIAKFLGVQPLELVFTSGGSEANNLALLGFYQGLLSLEKEGREHPLSGRRRFVTTKVEHPSVMKSMQHLEQLGVDVQYVTVNRDGVLDLKQFRELVNEETALVSVMMANNETGAVFPLKEMTEYAHSVGALVHTDAVQGLGKMDFNLKELDVDMASLSAHKFYSLRGAGALYVKKEVPLSPLIHGGAQERSRRAGTENVMAIAAFAEMTRFKGQIKSRSLKMAGLREHLMKRMASEIDGLVFNGLGHECLPNTLSVSIEGVDGESLLISLDLKGFAVSTGAACSSGSPEPSPTLLAMGLSREEAQSSLRISLGWETSQEQVDAFVDTLVSVVARLRSLAEDRDVG